MEGMVSHQLVKLQEKVGLQLNHTLGIANVMHIITKLLETTHNLWLYAETSLYTMKALVSLQTQKRGVTAGNRETTGSRWGRTG